MKQDKYPDFFGLIIGRNVKNFWCQMLSEVEHGREQYTNPPIKYQISRK